MQVVKEFLNGVFILTASPFNDDRGRFVKTYHVDIFKEFGFETDWREEFYSKSKKNVVRGMHYQSSPKQHSKMVYCLQGRVLDVVLDIRNGSPTYGKHVSFEISDDGCEIVLIPPGFAHGFCALTDDAILQYKVSTVYSPEHDMGILWSSFGCVWPTDRPILSARDKQLPNFSDIGVPFHYGN
ncbi:MAG: dTDP-4-dehydrorhamnose 3,5-epimerase [Pseudomonadota bacterium]